MQDPPPATYAPPPTTQPPLNHVLSENISSKSAVLTTVDAYSVGNTDLFYATKHSQTFTGTVALPSANMPSNDNTASTTQFMRQVVADKIDSIVSGAPQALIMTARMPLQ